MTAVVPEEPRRGQYLPTVTFVDSEGGGDLRVNAVMCETCFALVDEGHHAAHTGRHEAEAGSAPK
jgi:hypothetical protein